MSDICGDNRFEIIKRAKADLLDSTNIHTSPKEIEVLDDFLFRCWQMGWLDKYDDNTCECSVCGKRSPRPLGDYCRWCGAKMGRSDDETNIKR